MSRQVLGKRSHSSFSSSSSSPSRSPTPAPKSRHASVAFDFPSPDPTPNPKRVKTYSRETEEDDGSNKENIPPESIPGASNASDDDTHNSSTDASTSITTVTARDLRASRRASAISTRSTPVRRCKSSSRSRSSTTSSPSHTLSSPSSRHGDNPHGGIETPSKPMGQLSLVTPPPTPASMISPPRQLPDDASVTKPTSVYTIARALLRPQANASAPLVGREHERKQILDFLKHFLANEPHSDSFTSLYVSGAPGTGKTALVNEILASVTSRGLAKMDVDDTSLRVLYVNCMAQGVKGGMTGVWERCLEQLGGEKPKKREATTKMDWSERFGNLLGRRRCILVLDEIDHLGVSTSMSIDQIFALASDSRTRSLLRIIGISNTHTLTHAKRTAHSRTIHFQPYTSAQMKAVLGKRLESLSASGFDASNVFPASTIALLAFKIANETGDIRTVFSVARRALDLAAAQSQASTTPAVTPAHVLAALKAYNASTNTSQSKRDGAETVNRVRNLGLHCKFALAALILATKRTAAGLHLTDSGSSTSSGSFKENSHPPSLSSQGRDTATPAIEVTALHGFYAAIVSRGAHGAFHGVGRTEFGDLIGLLEGSGLVELAQGRGFGSKTRSPTKGKGTQVACVARGVRGEELVRGLMGSTNCAGEDTTVNVGEEEVKNVWERELRRLGKDVKARFGDAANKKADFDDAEED